jgi:hypothetical protein
MEPAISSTPKAYGAILRHPRRSGVTRSAGRRKLRVLAKPPVAGAYRPARTAFAVRREYALALRQNTTHLTVVLGNFWRAKYGDFSRAPKTGGQQFSVFPLPKCRTNPSLSQPNRRRKRRDLPRTSRVSAAGASALRSNVSRPVGRNGVRAPTSNPGLEKPGVGCERPGRPLGSRGNRGLA